MTATRAEHRVEAPHPAGKGAEAPEGVHNAVSQAYNRDTPAAMLRTNENTSAAVVPEGSFRKDKEGTPYVNFGPPRGAAGGDAPKEAAPKPADANLTSPEASDVQSRKLNNAVTNFNQDIMANNAYSQSRQPIEDDKVKELASAVKGMDGNQVADALRKQMGPENYKVSDPDKNGVISVDRMPVVDRGQDTLAFQIKPGTGEGATINTFPKDQPYRH